MPTHFIFIEHTQSLRITVTPSTEKKNDSAHFRACWTDMDRKKVLWITWLDKNRRHFDTYSVLLLLHLWLLSLKRSINTVTAYRKAIQMRSVSNRNGKGKLYVCVDKWKRFAQSPIWFNSTACSCGLLLFRYCHLCQVFMLTWRTKKRDSWLKNGSLCLFNLTIDLRSPQL